MLHKNNIKLTNDCQVYGVDNFFSDASAIANTENPVGRGRGQAEFAAIFPPLAATLNRAAGEN